MSGRRKVLVTGGAGYLGAMLTPHLLRAGDSVRVLDLFLYGRDVLDSVADHPRLDLMEGDLRDPETVRRAVAGCDSVIHLACISNDPSFELNPELGKSINLDAFEPLVRAARDAGVTRFIYASSSSVYGVQDVPEVVEETPLKPLTDYSRFKAECETILAAYQAPDFTTVTVRPATLCGYSPRQRLDLVVNILTAHAVVNQKIRVLGGEQKRPNLHILDMVDAYDLLLRLPDRKIAGQVYNIGFENHTVAQLAKLVHEKVGDPQVKIATEPTNDNRSYHISSAKIQRELGFVPKRTIGQAVAELAAALRDGRLEDPMNNPFYHNIKRMQELSLV